MLKLIVRPNGAFFQIFYRKTFPCLLLLFPLTFFVRYGILFREEKCMNEKNVRVKINSQMISLIDPEENGDGEKIEYMTDGILRDTGNTLELSYSESEDMGFARDTRTTLLFDKRFPLRVNMTRSGENSAGLAFDPDEKRQHCGINIGGLALEFCVLTNSVNNSLTMEGGAIDLDYVLEFRGCRTERSILRVEATPKHSEERI